MTDPVTRIVPVASTTKDGMAEPRSESELTAAFATPRAFIDAGHSQVAYYRFGAGPDLVFCHGWPVHSATFRRILPLLVPEFRCHLFDLPGAGRTRTGVGAPIELSAHAAVARRVVDSLGLDRFAWVAHDSGGVVARLAAADDPRVVGMVMGGSEIPGFRPWLIQMYAALAQLPGTARLVRLSMHSRFVRRSAIGFKGCFADPAYVDGDFHELFVRPLLDSQSVADEAMRLLRDLDFGIVDGLTAAHRRIAAPVRLIWGTEDPFFPIERARRMQAEFPDAHLVEIPRAKLFAHEDFPEEFGTLARDFLRECFARARTVSDAPPTRDSLKKPA